MSLQHFTKESFDQALNGGRLMMVDFWANWCMPCRMLGPVIQQLADQYDGKAVVGKVDVDAEGELAMRYGVMNIPTVIFFKDGKEIAREVGALPPEAFARILDEPLYDKGVRTCTAGRSSFRCVKENATPPVGGVAFFLLY